jgi:hypothetical protein
MPFGVTLETMTEASPLLSVAVTPADEATIRLKEKDGIGSVTVAMKVCVVAWLLVTTTLLVTNGSVWSVEVQLLIVKPFPGPLNGLVRVHVLLPSAFVATVPRGAKLAEQTPLSQIWTVIARTEPGARETTAAKSPSAK